MSMTGFNLCRQGIMQSPGVSSFTEQGIVADGSQTLDFGAKFGADTASSFMGLSMIATNPGAFMIPIAWAPGVFSDGKLFVVFPSAGVVRVGPQLHTNTGTIPGGSIDGVAGRIHALWSSSFNGSIIEMKVAVWDSTNGWQTTTANGPASSTVVEYTSDNNNLSLLRRVGSSENPTSGTIYRMFGWHGTTCDPTSATDRDKFFNGGSIEDPTVAHSAFGNPVFDCYGNAATWNSGTFTFGSFTKTGNAFTDA